MRARRRMKGLYVVKSEKDKLRELEPKKQTESRGVYVIRTSEEVINKFADIVYEFVDNGGIFLLVGTDKIVYQTLKRSLVFELGVDTDFIQIIHAPKKAIAKLEEFDKDGLTPFVLMEDSTEEANNLPVLESLHKAYPKVPVIVTIQQVDKDRLMQFYEAGANHVLNRSASVNEVLRKIVYILKPQTEIDELVAVGTKLNSENRFDEAMKVANTILSKRPKSARAHIIMGDALKGLAKRQAAMDEYKKAEKSSKMFIDPLKRIFMMHAEDGDKNGMLDYLIKLDDLSPLNFNRKVKIGDLNYDLGKVVEAEQYYDKAITAAVGDARTIVGEMSLDIAEKLCVTNPELAAKYFRKSLDLVKDTKNLANMNTFNRLGISLRKAGLWSEAVDAYLTAEKMSPGDENIQYNIALAYHEGKDFESAAQRMFLALKMNPKLYIGNAEVAYNIGVVFKDSGNMIQAQRMIRHALEIDPRHEGALKIDVS